MSMHNSIFDYDDGDIIFRMNDNIGIDSDGDLNIRMGDNMSMNMDTGELHITFHWGIDDDDD